MPNPNDDGGGRGPWGGGARPGAGLEGLVRQGQGRLKRIMPSGEPRGNTVPRPALALIAFPLERVVGLLHRAKRLRRRDPAFREVPQGGSAGAAFQAAAGHRPHGDDRAGQTASSRIRVRDPGRHDPFQNQSPRDATRETQMVTGDLNAALVEWVVQYRISDPQNFLFEVREPSETLRYVSDPSCGKSSAIVPSTR